ncbi:hypothetical protein ACHQM5_000366 [Ranunculus cassubicifolius]
MARSSANKLVFFLVLLLVSSDLQYMEVTVRAEKMESVHPPSQVIQTSRAHVELPGTECGTDNDCAWICGRNKKCLFNHCYCSPPKPQCSQDEDCSVFCGSCDSRSCDGDVCRCLC